MADSNFSSTTTHTQLDDFDEYLLKIGCDTSGRKVFSIILCILIGFMMLFMSFILYSFIKNRPILLFKTTCIYFIVAFIFDIDNILLVLNHCYSRDPSLQYIGFIFEAIGYMLGFQLFIGMLFIRLYQVFKSTTHAISQCTIYGFLVFQFMGFISLIFALLIDYNELFFSLGLLGGVLIILIGTPWVSGLYINKLYKVVYAKEVVNDARDDVNVNDKILTQIVKHTILTVISLSGTILTLIVAFVLLAPSNDDWFWMHRMSTLCIVVDFGTNVLAFVLGYSYTNNVYQILCGMIDLKSRAAFARIVSKKSQHLTSTKKKIRIMSVGTDTSTDTRSKAEKRDEDHSIII